MEKVAVRHCNTYQEEILWQRTKELLASLGGIENIVKPKQKVLLKVNLLMGKSAEAMVTTHPALVKVLVQILQKEGAQVIIGDSPGGPFNKKYLKKVYEKSGLAQVAQETKASLNYNVDSEKIAVKGEIIKSVIVAKYITEADVIINLPKLKTHGLTMYTGAVKNLFGAVPGLLKAEYHLKMPRVALFCQMLLDLAFAIQPTLNILDGVIGMEGAGPSAGDAKEYGYLMASSSPLALDIAIAQLLGIRPLTEAPLIAVAQARGLIASFKEIELLGDTLEPYTDINIPIIEKESNLLDQKLPPAISNFLNYILRPRPVFKEKTCVGCGDCVRICPAKTIDLVNKKPKVNLNNCIRCFCCQELCQYQAVVIKRPILGKILLNFST